MGGGERSEASFSASPHLQFHRGPDNRGREIPPTVEACSIINLQIQSEVLPDFLPHCPFFTGPTGVDAGALYGFHIQ